MSAPSSSGRTRNSGSYRIVDHERKIVPLCDLCKCRDVGHIQLWFPIVSAKMTLVLSVILDSRSARSFVSAKIVVIPKRFQIVVKTIVPPYRLVLVTISSPSLPTIFRRALVIAAMPDAGRQRMPHLFPEPSCVLQMLRWSGDDSCVRISAAFVVKQLLMLLFYR